MEEAFLSWTRQTSKGSKLKRELTEEHLQSMLGVCSFQSNLKLILRHIPPTDERNHIRLNLKHLAAKKNLEKDCTSMRTRLVSSALDESLKDLATEANCLKKLVEKETLLDMEERELELQMCLLEVATQDRKLKTRNFNQWKAAFELLSDSNTTSLQQESIRQEQANEDIKVAVNDLSKLNTHGTSEPFQHEDKVKIWDSVESLLAKHNPCTVVRAISSQATKETSSLSEATQLVDLAADARKLRLKHTSPGEFIDELRPEGVLESIEGMLVQMSGKHIQAHFRNHTISKEAAGTDRSLKSVFENIENQVKNVSEDPGLINEFVVLAGETLRLAGLKAALSASYMLASELKTRADDAKNAKKNTNGQIQTN